MSFYIQHKRYQYIIEASVNLEVCLIRNDAYSPWLLLKHGSIDEVALAISLLLIELIQATSKINYIDSNTNTKLNLLKLFTIF